MADNSLINIDVRLRQRYNSTEVWNRVNPVLERGEIGVECKYPDADKPNERGLIALKVGDGFSTWKELPYASGAGGGSTETDKELLILDKPADAQVVGNRLKELDKRLAKYEYKANEFYNATNKQPNGSYSTDFLTKDFYFQYKIKISNYEQVYAEDGARKAILTPSTELKSVLGWEQEKIEATISPDGIISFLQASKWTTDQNQLYDATYNFNVSITDTVTYLEPNNPGYKAERKKSDSISFTLPLFHGLSEYEDILSQEAPLDGLTSTSNRSIKETELTPKGKQYYYIFCPKYKSSGSPKLSLQMGGFNTTPQQLEGTYKKYLGDKYFMEYYVFRTVNWYDANIKAEFSYSM